MLGDSFERIYCLGRRDRPDRTIDIMEELGATYIDSRETPVSDIPDAYEPMDFIFEATGLRQEVGNQARVLNEIVARARETHHLNAEQLQELIGHTWAEVLGGFALGLLVAYLFF